MKLTLLLLIIVALVDGCRRPPPATPPPTTITTTTTEPSVSTTTSSLCPEGFLQSSSIPGRCFYLELSDGNRKNFTDARAACQGIGSNVDLATLDTQEVISIDLSETAHFGYCQSETKSETTFSNKNIFLTKILFPTNFFPKKFFSRIFSQAEFNLRLDFVSHYIPQLYFVCNVLMLYLC